LSDTAQPFNDFAIEGEYQDGTTSKTEPAVLRVHSYGCELNTESLRLELSPDAITLTDRISNTPRRITWGTEACFITKDNDAADGLARLLPGGELGRIAFRLEQNMALALTALVLVVALAGSFMLWGVPAGAKYLAHKIPDSVLHSAAEQTMTSLDQVYFEPSNLAPDRQQELERYFRAIDDYPAKILFRDAEDIGANAMALPGGYVVFTDQLVELAEHDDELLGVYLHEVGHTRFRHAEASALQSSAWLVTLSLITGEVSGASDALLSIPVLLGQAAFSRDLERAADSFAIEHMLRTKKSPAALADMLQRLSSASRPDGEQSRLLDYISSHPATEERLQQIRSHTN